MPKERTSISGLAIPAIALAFCVSAQAGASRTFVATTGNDGNTSANCGAATPCRTFGAALSVTNAGGELVVVNSGGYGPATILQPVIITAVGVDASISATAGAGLTISTTGNVTLTGLRLHGEGTASVGIEAQEVGFLRVYDALIENFTQFGLSFVADGTLAIYDSSFNDNVVVGVFVGVASATAYVQSSSFDHNGNAVEVSGGKATVTDSDAHNNNAAFQADSEGTLTLFNDQAISNNFGLLTFMTGTLYFSDCVIANNTKAYQINGVSTITGTSPGTSLIAPGQATFGTLGTSMALQ